MDLSTFASQKDFEDELLLLAALDGLVRVIYKNKSSLYLLPLSLCLRVGRSEERRVGKECSW